jgi:hypothetical protein
MRLLVLFLVGCGPTLHTSGVSLAAERQRICAELAEHCSILTGFRHATCMRHGPPRAPAREAWSTASWWLYETRYWELVPGNTEAVGPQVVCASYLAFTGNTAFESDEQCHRVTRYEP